MILILPAHIIYTILYGVRHFFSVGYIMLNIASWVCTPIVVPFIVVYCRRACSVRMLKAFKQSSIFENWIFITCVKLDIWESQRYILTLFASYIAYKACCSIILTAFIIFSSSQTVFFLWHILYSDLCHVAYLIYKQRGIRIFAI